MVANGVLDFLDVFFNFFKRDSWIWLLLIGRGRSGNGKKKGQKGIWFLLLSSVARPLSVEKEKKKKEERAEEEKEEAEEKKSYIVWWFLIINIFILLITLNLDRLLGSF